MEKKKVFVIMPFQDQFFEVYEMLKMQFADSFEFTNAADEGNQQNILKDIVQPIYEADVVIADLTGLNPNVMYELGLAHSFNKKTITITQDELSTLPFDLKQYRAKDYSTHFKKFAELLDYLKINLNGAVDNSVIYGNPVKDFLESAGIRGVSWFAEKEAVELCDESDKGFIDFLADIEANVSELWDEIEKNSIGLLENPFSNRTENRDGLIKYLKSLYDMKTAAAGSAESISGLRTTMQGIVGIERSMNQAVKFANEDLTTYVNFTERLCASIEKILIKARFVVGDIDYENIEQVCDAEQN